MDIQNTYYQERIGNKPLDNDTYTECHNTKEENAYEKHKDIIDLWKTTNFWLSCIGLYFLGKIAIALLKVILTVYAGSNIMQTLLH